eukprot:TRINITY_DN7533_c1_g1_i1.p1 TRINITY_DN7533_c1_g1~~TRINITY_DN7533_c1_g1_i1.p1  ORF type:complete len:597 (-),score=106.61 TRINITY_DN7533_c1_g1_i1:42-1832(-)
MWSGSNEGLWPPVMRNFFSGVLPGDDFVRDDPDLPIANPSGTDGASEVDGRHSERTDAASEPGGTGAMHEYSPRMKLTGFKEELLELWPQYTERKEIKIVAGTWNVAGLPAPEDLSIDDWMRKEEHPDADVYVIGFQEIVPLTANTVLGLEDEQRAHRWNEVLRQCLNKAPGAAKPGGSGPNDAAAAAEETGVPPVSAREEASASRSLQDISWQLATKCEVREEGLPGRAERAPGLSDKGVSNEQQLEQGEQGKVLDDIKLLESARSSTDTLPAFAQSSLSSLSSASHSITGVPEKPRKQYYLVASRQMVGIHLAIWVCTELRPFIRNVKVAVVGVGIINLGNKGSVALSMTLHETSFCFMCAHLSAGEKEVDVQKRLQDAHEILTRTHFTWTEEVQERSLRKLPKTVEMHDRVIWVGDFNFRVDMADVLVRELLAKEEWAALLEKDQLYADMHATGGSSAFKGWQEGEIRFAPTYKYVMNATHYIGDYPEEVEKRRTPAWCDRILWRGDGLQLLQYSRSEVMMSDHRPVTAVFHSNVDVIVPDKWRIALDQASAQLDKRADEAVPPAHAEENLAEFADEEWQDLVGTIRASTAPL